MSMREQEYPARTTANDVRLNDYGQRTTWRAKETKSSFLSTEFWAAVGGVVALIVIYNVSSDLSLDLFRACLLCTLLGMAYIVSRGFAKSGSRTERAENTRAVPPSNERVA